MEAMRSVVGQRLLLAALSAVLYFVGFVGFGQSYLTWFCFVPVLIAAKDLSPKKALLLGLPFGLLTHMGGYYWVNHLLTQFANLPASLAFVGYVLLCAYQGASLALVLFAVRFGAGVGLPAWVSLPAALAVTEWFYPFLFPSYVGNAFYRFTE
ncbi:MAG: hypothetical protein HYZ27_08590, partial [Deltaproteobacteria bacterium]|nr:hypothetical protein [Deltaproteobacteria bacterium]